jgi:hypothetical protein
MSHSQAASATAASLTVYELVRSSLAARGHPCRDDPGSVPAGSSAAYPISAQAHAAWSHRVPTPTARRLPVHREQRAASAPDDPHLRPHYETVKPALRDLPHWGAGGEIDGPAVSIGRQRLFSPSATSLGLATLELEVPRLLVEGQVNVGWPRPPFTHGKPASVHIANIVVKPGWTAASGRRRPPSWRGRAGARRPSEPVTAHAS